MMSASRKIYFDDEATSIWSSTVPRAFAYIVSVLLCDL